MLRKVNGLVKMNVTVYNNNNGTYDTTLYYEITSNIDLASSIYNELNYTIPYLYGFHWYTLTNEDNTVVKFVTDECPALLDSIDIYTDEIIDRMIEYTYNNYDDDEIIEKILDIYNNYSNVSIDIEYID